MSDESEKHRVHEAALASKDFLDTITRKACEHQLSRRLVISLFGLFAKHVIELHVEDGIEHREAATTVLRQFLRGAGIEAVFDDDIPKNLQ